MGRTNSKGELGGAMVLADLQRKGYGVAIPFGCYYLHSTTWSGLTRPRLRLSVAANGQVEGIRLASAHLYSELGEQPFKPPSPVAMLADPAPE